MTDSDDSFQQRYRIMIFSWNTESVSLSETMNPEISTQNRTSYSSVIPGITTWKYSCEQVDFYPKFNKFILDHGPDLIVIGFQEDRYPGSYFHSHLLPEEMPKIGYELVKRTKLMGVGVTSYKGVIKCDPFERGLRLSIYAKKELVPIIEKEETEMRSAMGNDGQSEYICSSVITRGKGAVASYIMLPGFGRIAFVCCHLPFNAKSLINERIYRNKMLRQTEINQSNVCFNRIIEKLVLFNGPVPTHVIYFGDFNYRLADPRPASLVATEINNNAKDIEYLKNLCNEHDELKEQMRRRNIYEFSEGISNIGPSFVPTGKMIKGRITDDPNDMDNYGQILNGVDYWKTGNQDQRVPSWCDRILYNKFSEDGHRLDCIYYDRFDVGTIMAKSDHAGIMGLFDLV
jgi:hypothetical protein